MLSFAIACATGAPIDTVDEDDSKRSSSNSSGGFNWEPTFENPTNPGSSQQMLYENPKQTE